jgi:predicted small metal-binding protein
MRKILRCGEIVPGCNFVAHGENEPEVVMKAAEHARAVHGVERMSEQLLAKVKATIRDQAPA